ncbi:MAG: Riboflavin biosynthesis protein RibF [Chlamydiae bacterium]|nr:Riboflavin biosynthesis protein RibF [Chlamydiota bacterium]
MRIIDTFEKRGPITKPIVITIGNFDGVHRGHQEVIARLTKKAHDIGGESVVISFVNHPSQVLRPDKPTLPLYSPEHKAHLLEKLGVDTLVFLSFTKEFAQQEAKVFLSKLMQTLPFSDLILGYDSRMGIGRKGDPATIQELSKILAFDVEYIGPFSYNGGTVSSSTIRELVRNGKFEKSKELLGRQYSIYAKVTSGNRRGSQLGYPTANIDVSGLTLPPYGVYAVYLEYKGKQRPGIANLGTAPTLRTQTNPILEVHLFEPIEELYGKAVEVFFEEYIRPEKKFADVVALQKQIAQDIETVKKYLF